MSNENAPLENDGNNTVPPKKNWYIHNDKTFRNMVASGRAVFLSTGKGDEKNRELVFEPKRVTIEPSKKTIHNLNLLIAQQYIRDMGLEADPRLVPAGIITAESNRLGLKKNTPAIVLPVRRQTKTGGWKDIAPELYPAAAVKNLNEYLDRHEFAAGDKTGERKGKDAFYRMYDAEKKAEKAGVEKPLVDARNTADPVQYLGKWLEATSIGGKFITDRESVNAVQKQLVQDIDRHFENRNWYKVDEMCRKAGELCRENLKERYGITKEQEQQQGKERPREVTHEREQDGIEMF